MKRFILILFSLLLIVGCKSSKNTTGPTQSKYSEGALTIRGTLSYDLDLGIELSLDEIDDADLFWGQQTASIRYFRPMNGAEFSLMGQENFDSIGYDELIDLNYSADDINGNDDATNQIPQGTVVAYITNENRYGKLIIDEYGYRMTVRWVTYVL